MHRTGHRLMTRSGTTLRWYGSTTFARAFLPFETVPDSFKFALARSDPNPLEELTRKATADGVRKHEGESKAVQKKRSAAGTGHLPQFMTEVDVTPSLAS